MKLNMTYTAHDKDDGDNQAIEADGGHSGNPDKQTVDSSFHYPVFVLVLWRKQAGHIQLDLGCFFWRGGGPLIDTFLESPSLYPLPAVESSDYCSAWPSEAGRWPPPRTCRCRGCCRLPCWSGGWRCRSRRPPQSLCGPLCFHAESFWWRRFLHSVAVQISWHLRSHWGRGSGRLLQWGRWRSSDALRRRSRRRTGTFTFYLKMGDWSNGT